MKTKSQMEAIKDIAELDDSLSLLRDNWLVCSEHNKARYMGLIDKVLDERLIAMAARDKVSSKTLIKQDV